MKNNDEQLHKSFPKKTLDASAKNTSQSYKKNVTFGGKPSAAVLEFLRGNAPDEYNVRTISKLLGISRNQVKVALHRLYKAGKVKRPHRGFYRATIDKSLVHSLGNPEIKFHGIKIEAKLSKPMDGITARIKALGFESKTNGRFCRVLWYEGRKITITLHCKGLVEIWVRSSDNPLNFEELRALLTFLNGFLEPLGPLANRVLRQIGLNKDYRSLRLDGVTSIPLNDFMNSVARIYQKEKDTLRVEKHIETNIELDEAICMLSRVSEPVTAINGRLSDIETKLNKVVSSVSQLLPSTDENIIDNDKNAEGDET